MQIDKRADAQSEAKTTTELFTIPALDGVRGLAIILVLAFHASYPFWRNRPDLEDALKLGWVGVDLFFVLSGFLITRILLNTLSRPRYFSTFYARRALRIFPLYYVFLAIFFVCLLLHTPLLTANPAQSEMQILLSAFYVQDYVIPSHKVQFYQPLLHTWSLAVEEQFYLLWPLLMWCAGRRRALPLCLILIAGSFLLRVFLLHRGFSPTQVYMYAPTRIDPLVGGAAVAVLFDRYGAVPYSIIVAALTAGLVLSTAAVGLTVDDAGFWTAPMAYFGFAGFDLFFCGLVALVVRGVNFWVAAFDPPLLRRIGRYSYCMYLVHFPIIMLCVSWGLPTFVDSRLPHDIAFLVFFGMVTAGTFILGHMSYKYVETPLQRLKAKIPY